jgi:hypothetical protein
MLADRAPSCQRSAVGTPQTPRVLSATALSPHRHAGRPPNPVPRVGTAPMPPALSGFLPCNRGEQRYHILTRESTRLTALFTHSRCAGLDGLSPIHAGATFRFCHGEV